MIQRNNLSKKVEKLLFFWYNIEKYYAGDEIMKFFDNKYIKTILPLILATITGITGNAIFSVKDGMFIFCIITLILSVFFAIVLAQLPTKKAVHN